MDWASWILFNLQSIQSLIFVGFGWAYINPVSHGVKKKLQLNAKESCIPSCTIGYFIYMTSFTLLILFASAGIASLLLVSFANQKQARAKIVRHKMQQLRLRVQDLEELVLTADQILESQSVAQLINDDVINMLESMLQLDNSAHYLEASLSSARARAENYASGAQNNNVNRIADSDAKIAKLQHALTEMGRIVRQAHAQSRINSDELQAFITELAWAHLMVDVISHVAQGYRAAMRNDFLSADAFYKRAKHSLVQTPQPDTRRNRMIKELGEMNAYRRSCLSTDLMHETVEGFDENAIAQKMKTFFSGREETQDDDPTTDQSSTTG